jgi:energy-coupling factor transporter ATP-binding protein EcfA2
MEKEFAPWTLRKYFGGMKFSYRVRGEIGLENIDVPLKQGEILVLTGVENHAFSLIGGIVAGLFPITERDVLPQIDELIKYFTGELIVHEGNAERDAVYLGSDPEKHLLFSRVNEEISAQLGLTKDFEGVLSLFGLGREFVKRKISTLSGGEKMKLALNIAFSRPVRTIVLHGVLPWLDREGKSRLFEVIEKARERKKSVVLLEQEIGILYGKADKVLYFDGSSCIPYVPEKQSAVLARITEKSSHIKSALEKGGENKEILRLESILFRYEQGEYSGFELRNVDCVLYSSRVYGLVGDNGTGKSTIARLILRTVHPERGKITLFEKDLSTIQRAQLRQMVCFVGQFPEQFITLSEVDQYKQRAMKTDNTLSSALLQDGFPENRRYPVATLSPIELKILLLASGISTRTRLVILDEPTWGIDLEGEISLLALLLRVAAEIPEMTFLIISHDLDFIRRLNADVLLLKGGKISQDTGVDRGYTS